MHGLIHVQLQKFVLAHHGRQVWQKLLMEAGVSGKTYLVSKQYPDEDVLNIVSAASRATGTPVPALLEQFGEFIVPDLMAMYRPMLQPEWRTLDMLEHTEHTIHSVVRLRNAEAAPAQLRCRRLGPDEVHLSYDSKRKMCAVARGIIQGVARHFEEAVTILETACMHRGAAACEMLVRRQGSLPRSLAASPA